MAKKTTTKTPRNAGKYFTPKAVDFIYDNAGSLTAAQIGKRLGRTTKAIRRKAEKLEVSLAV